MDSHIRDGTLDIKRELIGVMFPEKFEFDGETYRTNSYNKVLDLIYLQTNELRGQKKRDSSDFPEKSLQVRMKGLEPPHLSASDPKSDVSTIPPHPQTLINRRKDSAKVSYKQTFIHRNQTKCLVR